MQSVPECGSILNERYLITEIIETRHDLALLRCNDTRLDVPGIIKLLIADPDSPSWEARKQNFVQAFRAQAQIAHPNVVGVSNIEAKGPHVFAVMEHVCGNSLANFLDTAALLPKEVVELFLGVIDAVVMAHANGTLHKSISPRHILLSELGNRLSPKLTDFGYNYSPADLDPNDELPYLAPEQLLNFNHATPASDIYAICASMYYAFVHRPPVLCCSFKEYVDYCQSSPVFKPPAEIPHEFLPLIQSGLSTRPPDRPISIQDLLKRLKNLGSSFNLSANLTIEASRDPASGMPSSARISPIHQGSASAMRPIARNSSASLPSVPNGLSSDPSRQIYAQQNTSTSSMRRRVATTSVAVQSCKSISASAPGQYSKSISASAAGQYSKSISAPAAPAHDPDAPLFTPIVNAVLPPQLAAQWQVRSIISNTPHAAVLAVSRYDDPFSISIIKGLASSDANDIRIFNEAVQQSFKLSQKSPYFQNIVRDYGECAAYLCDDIQRQPMPETLRIHGLFTPAVALQIAILLAQAMAAAHQCGFVNGNIKPSNIIFETHGANVVPVIYDFAQNLYINSASRLYLSDIPFIDPFIDYNLSKTNIKSDIFSFGMLLIYMMIGRIPYASATPEALISEIDALGHIPDFYALRNDIPADLIRIIQWCTDFNPDQRYANFNDVIRDLYIVFQQLQ